MSIPGGEAIHGLQFIRVLNAFSLRALRLKALTAETGAERNPGLASQDSRACDRQ